MLEKIGKYQIVDRIGAGAMGEVYKAFDPMLKRWVALKVFSSNLEVTEELRARFLREAQAGAMLSHPNIVTVHDLGEQDGYLSIIMELLEGEELRQIITKRKDLALEQKLSLMIQVCKGVQYAHRKGVIHRDIKPGNIFVLSNGHVKLLDFGIARMAAIDSDLTRAGLVMGTLRYMSPEQCQGRADHRSDIFSVGAVFYELLTYRPAFSADNTLALLEQVQRAEPPSLLDLDPSFPEHLGTTVHRALRKEPSARFADIGDMQIELERIQQQLLEEAARARSRVQASLRTIEDLEHALAASAGTMPDAGSPVAADDTAPLASLQRIEAELGVRIDRLRSQIERVRSVESSLENAAQLMGACDYDAAIAVFERVLEEMPQHPRAHDGLRSARTQRQLLLATEIVNRAAVAMSRLAYSDCIRTLESLSDLGWLPSDIGAQALELRQAALARLSNQERGTRRPDVTLLGRTSEDVPRPPIPPRSTVANAELDGYDVQQHGRTGVNMSTAAKNRRRLFFEREIEDTSPISDYPAPGRRRRWVTLGVLAALTLILGTYWLGFIPARRQNLPAWLTDRGAGQSARITVDPVDTRIAAANRPDDPRGNSDLAGAALQPGAEDGTPATRVELPPRPASVQAGQAPDRPSSKTKAPPLVATPSAPSLPPRQTLPSGAQPAPKRSALSTLAADAPLKETVTWLTQALTEHAETGRLPSGVIYRVERLEGCGIEWVVLSETGAGYRVKAVLNSVDSNRTAVVQRDGGWIIDLPWAETESRIVGADSFAGMVVWFPERETATRVATAFKQAISLCSR